MKKTIHTHVAPALTTMGLVLPVPITLYDECISHHPELWNSDLHLSINYTIHLGDSLVAESQRSIPDHQASDISVLAANKEEPQESLNNFVDKDNYTAELIKRNSNVMDFPVEQYPLSRETALRSLSFASHITPLTNHGENNQKNEGSRDHNQLENSVLSQRAKLDEWARSPHVDSVSLSEQLLFVLMNSSFSPLPLSSLTNLPDEAFNGIICSVPWVILGARKESVFVSIIHTLRNTLLINTQPLAKISTPPPNSWVELFVELCCVENTHHTRVLCSGYVFPTTATSAMSSLSSDKNDSHLSTNPTLTQIQSLARESLKDYFLSFFSLVLSTSRNTTINGPRIVLPFSVPLHREYNAWGCCDIIYEQPAPKLSSSSSAILNPGFGLVRLNLSEGKYIPWHTHDLMAESELIISPFLCCCGRSTLPLPRPTSSKDKKDIFAKVAEVYPVVYPSISHFLSRREISRLKTDNSVTSGISSDSRIFQALEDSETSSLDFSIQNLPSCAETFDSLGLPYPQSLSVPLELEACSDVPSSSLPSTTLSSLLSPGGGRRSVDGCVCHWGNLPHSHANPSPLPGAILCITRPIFQPNDEHFIADQKVKDITTAIYQRPNASNYVETPLFTTDTATKAPDMALVTRVFPRTATSPAILRCVGLVSSPIIENTSSGLTIETSSSFDLSHPFSSLTEDYYSNRQVQVFPADSFVWANNHIYRRQEKEVQYNDVENSILTPKPCVMNVIFPGAFEGQSVCVEYPYRGQKSDQGPCDAVLVVPLVVPDSMLQLMSSALSLTYKESTMTPAITVWEKWLMFVKHKKRGWELPGGKVDPGEDEIQAALRELAEEAGESLAQYVKSSSNIYPLLKYTITEKDKEVDLEYRKHTKAVYISLVTTENLIEAEAKASLGLLSRETSAVGIASLHSLSAPSTYFDILASDEHSSAKDKISPLLCDQVFSLILRILKAL